MKITGSYTVPVPREKAYTLLQDPDILAKCMPGTQSLTKIGEDHYEMKMKMMIAALSGSFDGQIRLADQNPPESFRLLMDGSGKIGFVKGDGLLKLSSNGDSTTKVDYEGEVHVGGTIAAVGQRLLDTTSKMIIRKFFDKLVGMLGKSDSGAPP
jgi:carbon monoxide dehydrogenase subunit G